MGDNVTNSSGDIMVGENYVEEVYTVQEDGWEVELLAIVIRGKYTTSGTHFFTGPLLPQQVAYMSRSAGEVIEAHTHRIRERIVGHTSEVFIIRKGRLRVDIYDTYNKYRMSKMLGEGDIIVLIQGGHGLEILEDVEMIEVKQGPYLENSDKLAIRAISKDQLKVD